MRSRRSFSGSSSAARAAPEQLAHRVEVAAEDGHPDARPGPRRCTGPSAKRDDRHGHEGRHAGEQRRVRAEARQVLAERELEAAERRDQEARRRSTLAAAVAADTRPRRSGRSREDHELGQREAAPRRRRALVDRRPAAGVARRRWRALGRAPGLARSARAIALGARALGSPACGCDRPMGVRWLTGSRRRCGPATSSAACR